MTKPNTNNPKYVIVHCSATPEGRDVTAKDIDRFHRTRGFAKIGYHYVIRLDGTIEKGRGETEIGAHCLGKNACSIGVCYVGGIKSDGSPADTRTPCQKAALASLLVSLRKRYPGIEIRGHRDFAAKACPSFDATREYKSLCLAPLFLFAFCAISCKSHKVSVSETGSSCTAVTDRTIETALRNLILDSLEIEIDRPSAEIRTGDTIIKRLTAEKAVLRRKTALIETVDETAKATDSVITATIEKSHTEKSVAPQNPFPLSTAVLTAGIILSAILIVKKFTKWKRTLSSNR